MHFLAEILGSVISFLMSLFEGAGDVSLNSLKQTTVDSYISKREKFKDGYEEGRTNPLQCRKASEETN